MTTTDFEKAVDDFERACIALGDRGINDVGTDHMPADLLKTHETALAALMAFAIVPAPLSNPEAPAAPVDGVTYYDKGKDAPWFEALSDKDFAREACHMAQDINDTGLGDDLDRWMPFQAVISDAAERINRLVATPPAPTSDAIIEFATEILHGDDEHRSWLMEAAEAFNAGTPLPTARGKGTGHRSAPTSAVDGARPMTYGQKLIAEAIEAHFGERNEDYDEDVDDTSNHDAWEAFDADLSAQAVPAAVGGAETVRIEHDGFEGTVQGSYVTREGKPGVVLQQIGTRVVHVYGKKWVASGGQRG